MILNMIGGGGGSGSSFNFTIVGGASAPESPKENTIWINTDVAITDWSFDTAAPENPAEGTVWITIGATGAVSFNALKNNCIKIYPLFANQYVEGTWVTKEARSYQAGEWHDWIIYLFTNGNQNESMTGGWSNSIDDYEADGWSRGDANTFRNVDASTVAIGDTMVLDLNIGDNSSYEDVAAVGTRNAIDMTNYSKIKVKCSLTNKAGQANGRARLAIGQTRIVPYKDAYVPVFVEIPEGTSEVELDVSEFTGEYYILIGGCSGTVGYTLTITIVTIE